MTSSDWMMLALSAQLGEGSQRAIGESFVRRLLEMGEIHPAVAILLSMGESNVAVEVYSLHQCFLEAILLNCVVRPSQWESQSQLLRRWGEWLITQPNMTETAVRCFSCASMKVERQYESSTEGSASESDSLAASTPVSPPAASRIQRLAAMNAPLKLITDFSSSSGQANRRTPNPDTIISLDSGETWRGQPASSRDRSESRTATPGSYTHQRLPSAGTRTSSANRRPAAGHSSRASSQRPGSADTPSTAVRTAKPPTDLATLRSEIAGLAAFQLTGPDRRKSITPSISISDTGVSESSKTAHSQVGTESEADDGPSFLEDASRRVSHMMSMQGQHVSPDDLHPPVRSASASNEHIHTQHKHRHTRHASENVSQAQSHKIKSGSPTPDVSSSHVSNDRIELSRKQLAALELEERRRSLLRRPSIPVIPHPSELVPQARSNVSSASTSKSNKSTLITLPATVYSRGSSIERSATAGPALMLKDVASHAMMRKASKEFKAGGSAMHSTTSATSTTGPSAGTATPYILQPLTYSRPPLVPRSVSAPPEEPVGRRGGSASRSGIETIPETPRIPITPTPSPPRHHHRPAADERVLPQLAHLITSFPPPTLTHPALRSGVGVGEQEDEEAITDDDDESSGIIHIAIDDPNIISPVTIERARGRAASFNLERERERAKTVSPGGLGGGGGGVTPIQTAGATLGRSQSRGAGGQTPVSGGGGATSSLGSMWYNVGRRIRSGSRSSAAAAGSVVGQSPNANVNVRMPYETNLDTLSSTVYDGGNGGSGGQVREAGLLQRGISPASAMQGGYRTPKEIREQMVRDGLL